MPRSAEAGDVSFEIVLYFLLDGVSYKSSMHAWGACGPGALPGTPKLSTAKSENALYNVPMSKKALYTGIAVVVAILLAYLFFTGRA